MLPGILKDSSDLNSEIMEVFKCHISWDSDDKVLGPFAHHSFVDVFADDIDLASKLMNLNVFWSIYVNIEDKISVDLYQTIRQNLQDFKYQLRTLSSKHGIQFQESSNDFQQRLLKLPQDLESTLKSEFENRYNIPMKVERIYALANYVCLKYVTGMRDKSSKNMNNKTNKKSRNKVITKSENNDIFHHLDAIHEQLKCINIISLSLGDLISTLHIKQRLYHFNLIHKNIDLSLISFIMSLPSFSIVAETSILPSFNFLDHIQNASIHTLQNGRFILILKFSN